MLLVDLSFKNKDNCKLNLYTTDCQDEVLVMRAHGSLHMHQCSYNSQGYTGRAPHLFNLPSHPGSLHSDPTGVQCDLYQLSDSGYPVVTPAWVFLVIAEKGVGHAIYGEDCRGIVQG